MSDNVENLTNELMKLEAEVQKLKDELTYQSQKHEQWKKLAMCFHDSLWQLIDKYIMTDV